MRRLRDGVGLVISLLLAASACGSSGGVPASSGLDRTKLVRDLSDTELGRLCDWAAAQLGGYAQQITCDGGLIVRSRRDQAACIREFQRTASCTATVDQAEACERQRVAQPCSLAPYTNPSAECSALATCAAPPSS